MPRFEATLTDVGADGATAQIDIPKALAGEPIDRILIVQDAGSATQLDSYEFTEDSNVSDALEVIVDDTNATFPVDVLGPFPWDGSFEPAPAAEGTADGEVTTTGKGTVPIFVNVDPDDAATPNDFRIAVVIDRGG